ncbi:MAG TPA: TIM-barrel domain-containing protein [Candidatus Sulfotelmatobacter sp.]|nr:TIM-barrel domain-containing protein [Candidatus Sulfotelmatobacter sp.]
MIKLIELALPLFLSCSAAFCTANGTQFAISESHPDSNGITLRSAAGTMRIEACGDRVIHVVASPTAEIPSPKVPVVSQPCRASNVVVKVGKKDVKLSTAAVSVTVNAMTGAVSFLSKRGDAVLSEPAGGGKAFDVPAIAEMRTWQVQQTFISPLDEALYGLGQHQEGIFNVRGVPIRLHQANTNISIPFLLSSKGYGILWNNPSLTDFNPADLSIAIDPATGKGRFTTDTKGTYGFVLSSDNRTQLTLQVGGQKVIDLQNEWTPTSASGSISLEANKEYEVSARGGPGGVQLAMRPPQDETTFRSELGQAIDYYFFYGPQLNQVISEYRQLTGEAPLFPKWAYGYWQCRERYHSQQEILDTAAEFRKRKIPVDVLVQDWQYWGKYGWNAMKFDEDHYPQPKEMLNQLHADDLHMMISIWSKFGEDTDVYKRMSAKSFLVPGTPWTDFFNPAAQAAFWSELKNGIFADGMDAWWMDASEPEFDALHGKQTFLGSGDAVRNAYPLYVTKAIYEGQRSTTDRKRVVILTRSAFAGQQRNAAASWSGDISSNWITLRRQISAGLSFSMSGIPYWTTDVGGFFRPEDQYTSDKYHELLIRWFEYGTFCPIFRVHGYKSNAELWNYGPEVEKILTQYDELRYRLLPYIYSSAWGVTHHGETLMRALPLEFPFDSGARQISDQFLFGPTLLINPVTTEGALQRSLYLPAGSDWFDFWTGKRLTGDQIITAETPLDRIPILVKSGSILPMGPLAESVSTKSDPIDLRIYAGAEANFTLYEDEGDNYDYEHGVYSLIPLHWDDKREELTIGTRVGVFPGMLGHRIFRVMRVNDGHGVGMDLASKPDATIQYDGNAILIKLPKSAQRSKEP